MYNHRTSTSTPIGTPNNKPSLANPAVIIIFPTRCNLLNKRCTHFSPTLLSSRTEKVVPITCSQFDTMLCHNTFTSLVAKSTCPKFQEEEEGGFRAWSKTRRMFAKNCDQLKASQNNHKRRLLLGSTKLSMRSCFLTKCQVKIKIPASASFPAQYNPVICAWSRRRRVVNIGRGLDRQTGAGSQSHVGVYYGD